MNDPDQPEGGDDSAGVRVDFRAVARVASRVQLLMVRMRSCQADLVCGLAEVPRNWSETTFSGFQTHVASKPDVEGTFQTRAAFLALFQRDVDLKQTGLPEFTSENPPDVVLEVMFELDYRLDPNTELQDDDLDQFALANSTLHAWPYWRELAQSMTTRMGLAPLVIGSYKLPSALDPPD